MVSRARVWGGSYFPHVIAKEEFHNNYADYCIQSLLKCIPSKVVWLLANKVKRGYSDRILTPGGNSDTGV